MDGSALDEIRFSRMAEEDDRGTVVKRPCVTDHLPASLYETLYGNVVGGTRGRDRG